MKETITAISNFMRALASLAVVSLIGVGGWLGYQTFGGRLALDEALKTKQAQIDEQNLRIERLNKDVEAKNKKIQQLDTAVRLLKIDHRVAQMTVISQLKSDVTGKLLTTVEFVEMNEQGQPLGKSQHFTVEGDVVYIDGLAVKYLDEHVEQGDPLRGTSAFLFRRIYGEHQEPAQGSVIDTVGQQPAPYGGSTKMSEVDRDIWTNFWDYANDPAKRERAGIRAAHGEAAYMRVQKNKLYKVQLRASDGVSIVAEEMPATTKPL